MEPKVDVFKKHAGGAWWVQAVATEAEARSLVKGLMTHWPTEYVIFNQETGEKILIKPDLRSKTTAA